MAAARTDHALERMVFFSDAVFAIAITILVIELRAPELPSDASDALHLEALGRLMPNIASFVISFAVIGAFWTSHHRAFSLAAHYSPRVLVWNLLLLGVIAFMPFVTAYSGSTSHSRVPATFYCLMMLAAALLSYKVNRIATSPPMVHERASPAAIASVRGGGASVILGSATAIALVLAVPAASKSGLFSIFFWALLLHWRAKRRLKT